MSIGAFKVHGAKRLHRQPHRRTPCSLPSPSKIATRKRKETGKRRKYSVGEGPTCYWCKCWPAPPPCGRTANQARAGQVALGQNASEREVAKTLKAAPEGNSGKPGSRTASVAKDGTTRRETERQTRLWRARKSTVNRGGKDLSVVRTAFASWRPGPTVKANSSLFSFLFLFLSFLSFFVRPTVNTGTTGLLPPTAV